MLELLFAVIIGGLTLVAAYRGLSMAVKVYHFAVHDLNRQAHDIMDLLSRDLRSAFITKNTEKIAGFKGARNYISFTTTLPLGNDDALVKYGELVHVSFRHVSKGASGSIMYSRKPYHLDDSEPKDSHDVHAISHDVSVLRFSFFDGENWQDAWTSESNPPLAVRIFLTLSSKNSKQGLYEYETIVEIPSSS